MRKLDTSPLRIVAVLALVALLAGSAFAQSATRTRGFPAGLAEARLIREMPEEIGVDEEMLAKLDKLVEEIRAQDEQLKGKTLEAHNKTSALLDQNRPDEKELMAAVGAASGVARQIRELRVGASLRIRALLTEEQLVKFMEIRKKAVAKRSSRKQKRGR
jgi:Spy/CpxP family protein refolding chaperone